MNQYLPPQSTPIEVETAADGEDFTPFAAAPCRRLKLLNAAPGAVALELRKAGETVVLPVPAFSWLEVLCAEDAAEWELRRADQADAPVTVAAVAVL